MPSTQFSESKTSSPNCSPQRRTATAAAPAPIRKLIDIVVAAVDIEGFAGDEPRRVVRKESGGNANAVDTDDAARGGPRSCFVEESIEFRDSGGGSARLKVTGYSMGIVDFRHRINGRMNSKSIADCRSM